MEPPPGGRTTARVGADHAPSLIVMFRSSSFLKRTVWTPEMALTTVDLPWATWPMVPAGVSTGAACFACWPRRESRARCELAHQRSRGSGDGGYGGRAGQGRGWSPHCIWDAEKAWGGCMRRRHRLQSLAWSGRVSLGARACPDERVSMASAPWRSSSGLLAYVYGCLPADDLRGQRVQCCHI